MINDAQTCVHTGVTGSRTEPIRNEFSSCIYLRWVRNAHGYFSAPQGIGQYDGKEVGVKRDTG